MNPFSTSLVRNLPTSKPEGKQKRTSIKLKLLTPTKTPSLQNWHLRCANSEFFFDDEAETITDRVRATRQWATTPTEDPNDQSGREDRINVLIDQFDKDFESIPDFAFLVSEVEKNLSPEHMKAGTMNEAYNKLSPSEYKHVFDVPGEFREAWDHPDPLQKEKWWAGIRADLAKMNKNKVWRKTKRSKMPSGRRCVKHKWVFDI
jgi:hypothetical protein